MNHNLFKQWPIDFVLTCIHEAGHGVTGVSVGWNIGPGGIRADDHWIAYLQRPVYNLPGGMAEDFTANREPIINLAGRLAENKFQDRELIYCDDTDLKDLICEFRMHGPEEIVIDETLDDLTATLICYKKLYPDETIEEWFKRFRRDEKSTAEMLNTENTWQAITTVANELMNCDGYLEQERAIELIQELM